MPATNPTKSSAPEPRREERIEAIRQQLRPRIEPAVRQIVERAVDVPEAEEFGAIDTVSRDAGQRIATDVTCRVRTVHGEVRVRRAYYRGARCPQSFVPYDEALGLRDSIGPGFRPRVCRAGTLAPFADAAGGIVRRYTGARLSASTRCVARVVC